MQTRIPAGSVAEGFLKGYLLGNLPSVKNRKRIFFCFVKNNFVPIHLIDDLMEERDGRDRSIFQFFFKL